LPFGTRVPQIRTSGLGPKISSWTWSGKCATAQHWAHQAVAQNAADLDAHVDDRLRVGFVAAVLGGNQQAHDAGVDHRVDHLVGQAPVLLAPPGIRSQHGHDVRDALDDLFRRRGLHGFHRRLLGNPATSTLTRSPCADAAYPHIFRIA
jgi:hypothetical protein